MTALYRPVWAIEIGPYGGTGVRYEGLHIAATARQPGYGQPAIADVRVWNLPTDIRDQLYRRDTLTRVYAGYEAQGAALLIHGGTVRYSVKPDLSNRDPSVAWQVSSTTQAFKGFSLSKAYQSGTKASAIIEDIRLALGVPAASIELPADVSYARGYVVQGAPAPTLSSICADCGAQWSLQDGQLQIWPLGGPASRRVDLWTAGSGLIEATAPGSDFKVRATALLRPSLRPGATVRVESPTWTGTLAVIDAQHEIDTASDRWHTSVIGWPSR